MDEHCLKNYHQMYFEQKKGTNLTKNLIKNYNEKINIGYILEADINYLNN